MIEYAYAKYSFFIYFHDINFLSEFIIGVASSSIRVIFTLCSGLCTNSKSSFSSNKLQANFLYHKRLSSPKYSIELYCPFCISMFKNFVIVSGGLSVISLESKGICTGG